MSCPTLLTVLIYFLDNYMCCQYSFHTCSRLLNSANVVKRAEVCYTFHSAKAPLQFKTDYLEVVLSVQGENFTGGKNFTGEIQNRVPGEVLLSEEGLSPVQGQEDFTSLKVLLSLFCCLSLESQFLLFESGSRFLSRPGRILSLSLSLSKFNLAW